MSRTGNNTFERSNSRHNVARILASLTCGKTYAQLQAELHMTTRSLSRYMAHLGALPNRRVFIRKWLLIDSRYSPVFSLGKQPDAPKPKIPALEHGAKRRAKVKACPELSMNRANHDAARWAVQKAMKARNTWLSSLGAM